ncbi:GTP-binding protein, putative [Plasmodium ovale]|uniref:GTP-binding protein, putative n=1 Tax=Plasmodium ovale TaxID=36330 RepID=A0A1D3KXW3_PLAOA|nr:GTP-binding protein, putative [Plasmodium ovale]
MKFVFEAIILANVYYSLVFAFLEKKQYTCNQPFFTKNNSTLKGCKSKRGKRPTRRCDTTLCMLWEEKKSSHDECLQDDKSQQGSQGSGVESVKFYGFSRIYKHLNLDEEGLARKKKEKEKGNEEICSDTNSLTSNQRVIFDAVPFGEESNEEKEFPSEKEPYVETNINVVNERKNNLLVKDDPQRIQKVLFENVYDYSSIFKEKEKKVHVKKYVANIFQKMPKFRDNMKVIKDALLYLKFIEKGNLYLIKNVDKKSVNTEPYIDFSNTKKKKGTKKDKIKLELTSIYNNINKEKHTKKRICKECCIKIDLYTKILTRPLNNIYNMHKNLKKYLHPFQYSLYENATTNMFKDGEASNSLSEVLNNILEVRKLITVTGKTYAGQLKYLKTCREIFKKLNEAIVDLNIILQSGRKWLDLYNSYIKKIRKIKYIDLTKPAISIVGCTNVGKSSILNSITNSKSKIADYNFTTKEFNLGHYSFTNKNDDIITTQIMDLPGLINRKEEKRNLMEKLSLSSLKNIPSGVIYVFDPIKKNDHKFSSLESQIEIRYYLRGLFPFRPWIDVVTKSDLISSDMVNLPKDIKENALFISTENRDSLLPLREKINEVTYKLSNFLSRHVME